MQLRRLPRLPPRLQACVALAHSRADRHVAADRTVRARDPCSRACRPHSLDSPQRRNSIPTSRKQAPTSCPRAADDLIATLPNFTKWAVLIPLGFVLLPGMACAAPQQATTPAFQAFAPTPMQHCCSTQQTAVVDAPSQLACQSALASISTASLASTLSHVHATHVAKVLTYQAQRLLTRNIMTKLVALFILGTPFIAVGGALYKQAARETTWKEALFKSYAVLQNVPGADATAESDHKAAVVLNAIFQIGLLTFAVVLGVVTSDISSAVEHIQSGNYAVVESGHTVILNWNKLTIPVLRQMAVARAEHQEGTFKGPVVILADMDKADMDAAVAKGLQGPNHLEVLTRAGRPHSITDLEKAAAGHAKIVVVLHPDGAEEGAAERKIAAVVGVQALGGGAQAGQNVLIQSGPSNDDGDALLATASHAALPRHTNLGLIEMKDQERIDRLVAQCAIQPGLGKVYSQILLQSHTSAEFYMKDMFPSMVGKTYVEARRCFDQAVLCGLLDASTDRAELNPADSTVLEPQHRLIFLSSTARIKPTRQAAHSVDQKSGLVLQQHQGQQASFSPGSEVHPGKEIVVISSGAEEDVESLAQGMADFAPPGSRVTLVSPGTPDKLPDELGSCQFRHLQGSIASRRTLLQAGVATADAVILRTPLESLENSDADAQVVASLIQLQELAQAEGRTAPLHTIASVRHPRTIELINYITAHGHAQPSSSHNHSHSMQRSGHAHSTSDLSQHQAHNNTAVRASPGEQQNQSQISEPGHHGGDAFADMQAVTGNAHRGADRHDSRDTAKQRHWPAPVLSVDVLLPDELLSGLLTQCSVQPELLSVMEDLFDSAGAEIYLRQPSRYQLEASGKAGPAFAQVAEAVRQQEETALGFVLKNGTVVSAPNARHQQHLGPGDQIIVLANKA